MALYSLNTILCCCTNRSNCHHSRYCPHAVFFLCVYTPVYTWERWIIWSERMVLASLVARQCLNPTPLPPSHHPPTRPSFPNVLNGFMTHLGGSLSLSLHMHSFLFFSLSPRKPSLSCHSLHITMRLPLMSDCILKIAIIIANITTSIITITDPQRALLCVQASTVGLRLKCIIVIIIITISMVIIIDRRRA